MMELLSYNLSYLDITLMLLAATLFGMGKTGVYGAGMLAIPIMAHVFGAKASTGIVLSMLIFADLFAVRHYYAHADWPRLKSLMPSVMLGVILGTLFGEMIDAAMFVQIMAMTIFVCLAIMVWQEMQHQIEPPSSTAFVTSIGIMGGFTSMVGNLAGPIMAIFFLAMQFPKHRFIGTAAIFFLLINLIKMPFHIWVWNTVTWNSFALSALMLPAIGLGAYFGVRVLEFVPERPFRIFVIVMTLIAAVSLLL